MSAFMARATRCLYILAYGTNLAILIDSSLNPFDTVFVSFLRKGTPDVE